jgi:hypothetical protein
MKMGVSLRSPKEVRDLVARRYQSKHRQWLGQPGADGGWPLTFTLDPPSEKESIGDTATLGQWIGSWQTWSGAGQVIWEERRWNRLGIQTLPVRLELHCPRDVAAVTGRAELARWDRAIERRIALLDRWPALEHELGRHFAVLADFDEMDFDRMVRMVQWLADHRQSGLYARQIPVEGLDTKWIESRRQVVQQWLAVICGDDAEGKGFFEICGLRRPPDIARILLLDASMRQNCLGVRDISSPVEDLAQTDLRPEIVLIVENKTTGQALPDIPGTIAIVGRGYAIDLLGMLPWAQRAQCYYWGDIDTHGFAILHRARHYVPELQSVMMDKETLERHATLCVDEEKRPASETLNRLTPSEQQLYTLLKERASREPTRLEQERLNWSYVLNRLSSTLGVQIAHDPIDVV